MTISWLTWCNPDILGGRAVIFFLFSFRRAITWGLFWIHQRSKRSKQSLPWGSQTTYFLLVVPPPIPKSWIHPCYGLVVCMVYDLPDLIHTWLSIRDSSHIVANYSGFALTEIPDFPVHPGSLTALGTCLDTLFPIVCTEYSLVCSARSTSPHSLADSGVKSSL